MRIEAYSAAAALDEVQFGNKRRKEENLFQLRSGDTISFSDEALAKLEAAQQLSSEGTQNKSSQDGSHEQQEEAFSGNLTEKAAQGQGTQEPAAGDDALSKIEAKIKELMQKIAQVAQSDINENAKQGTIAALNSQIQELMSQKQELEAQAKTSAA